MQWIRSISLVKRVVYGFASLGTVFVGMGGGTAWLLSQQAATTSVAWAVGAATVAGAGLSLVASRLIVGSIKASVENTVQCVVRISSGDLEAMIEARARTKSPGCAPSLTAGARSCARPCWKCARRWAA